MIGIVDYGSGNVRAIANIYRRSNIDHLIVNTASQLDSVDKLVLPGVGAFDESMKLLQANGIRDALSEHVLERRVPVLGVCVGMQIMANRSEEGRLPGLGWIDADVVKLPVDMILNKPHLPHMGWNTIDPVDSHWIFDGVDPSRGFYFLHSYCFVCHDTDNVLATTVYGAPFCSAVVRGNVFGFQFHPEKSHQNGIAILRNFAISNLC